MQICRRPHAARSLLFDVLRQRPINELNKKKRWRELLAVESVLRQFNVAPGRNNVLPKQQRLRDVYARKKL